jgi:hypothetical protein
MDQMDQMVTEIGGCGSCSSRQDGGAKRKLSAYNIFMKKEMKAVKKANPSKSAAECMKMAARKWRAAHPKKASTSSKSKSSASKKTSKPRSRK